MRKALLLLTFLTLTIRINAQEIEWQRTIGGDGRDELYSIINASDGGYVLAGFSSSNISGDKTENSNGDVDYWIVKVDSIGNIQWQNTIGGNAIDHLNSIIQTTDGGYLLGGDSYSNISGDKTENSYGENDFWIVKVNSIGSIQWQTTIGGNNVDHLTSVVQTGDEGFLLGGSSMSDISGVKTENSMGFYDYWIVKIDSSGNILWQNTIGGNFGDILNSVTQLSNGGLLLGGSSESNISGDKIENSNGNYDYWIVEVDSLGTIQWQNSIGGGSNDELKNQIITPDSGYLLSGWSYSNVGGDKSEDSNGFSDFWIIKCDSSGIIEWQRTFGGSSFDNLYYAMQCSNGSFALVGTSQSNISGNKTENKIGGNDFWIVKIDANGNILWQNTIGGDGNEQLLTVIESDNEGYLIGGYSNSNNSFDKTENSKGLTDFWIVKISGNYNLIQGKTFADLNSNQTQEPADPAIPYLKISESITNRFAFSQSNGLYSVAVLDTGNFEIIPDYVNLFNPVPLVHTGNFTTIHQIDSLNNFAFQPSGITNDICVSITPIGRFRSGFNASYSINYSNQGTTTLIPTIVFYPDTNVSFVSASITPTTVTSDSVIFVLTTLTPFQTGQISITVSVDLGLPIGTLVNSGAIILPIANDANPGCNSSYWEVLTTGSFDPNDILVNRSFLYDYEMPAPPDLEYIIRFQNTGNDTAFTVKILNPLDTTRLDLSTLDIVSTSHDADVRFVYHERNLEFVMNNILLPDSNTNELMSHGFVRYRIKPKTTVAVGDSIQNFAAIYFDFNAPVITNTAVTHIILPTGLATTHQNSPPVIFPNPSNSKITIQLMEIAQKINTITIYNLYGQQVKSLEIVPASSTEVDISSLAQGVYFVKINNDHQFISKIVKY